MPKHRNDVSTHDTRFSISNEPSLVLYDFSSFERSLKISLLNLIQHNLGMVDEDLNSTSTSPTFTVFSSNFKLCRLSPISTRGQFVPTRQLTASHACASSLDSRLDSYYLSKWQLHPLPKNTILLFRYPKRNALACLQIINFITHVDPPLNYSYSLFKYQFYNIA